MKKYTFEIEITEGNDEFWENIEGKSGCDEVQECITKILGNYGFHTNYNCKITLKKYDSGD